MHILKIHTHLLLLAMIATVANASEPVQATPTDKKAVFKESLKGGGLGCAVGALFGKLAGGDLKSGCVAGGVAGALQAGIAEHKRQVREAQDLAEEAKRAGYGGQVETVAVEVKSNGKSEKAEGLDRLVLTFEASDFAGDTTELDRVLIKAAKLSDRSKAPITIEVGGSKSQRSHMVQVIKENLVANSQTILLEVKGGSPRLTITPIPN